MICRNKPRQKSFHGSFTGKVSTALQVGCFFLLVAYATAMASDHADPIDPFNKNRQEGGLTGLFVFPVFDNGRPAHLFERKANLPLHDTLTDIVREPLTEGERAKIDAVIFILCIRRQLTDSTALQLEPYIYRIHIDVDSTVAFPSKADLEAEANAEAEPNANSADITHGEEFSGAQHSHEQQLRPTLVEAFARYGGKILKPESIQQDITVEFRLNNEGQLQSGYPRYLGPAAAGWNVADIKSASGIYEDPFIFPMFFGTNVVAVAMRVPISLFPKDRDDYLIWADSHDGKRQIDHVGRSLRTQNPRFDLLNTLHPSKHVSALLEEHENPSLMRDVFLRLNLSSLFAYRKWDFVPDVMCFSTRFPSGFPNGRFLTDDVAAILAQHGDTTLYELSYQDNNGKWPRQTSNDRQFGEEFPYLVEPFSDRPQPPPPSLTTRSVLKLLGLGVLLVVLFVFENWLVARWYHGWKSRRRYL